ncbi:MAG: hypothetical protein HQ594_00375 [Candidatus Omnitrophica bacterium]|nr:hypothetical protein [Candidatus Omnitrophota bacterium]
MDGKPQLFDLDLTRKQPDGRWRIVFWDRETIHPAAGTKFEDIESAVSEHLDMLEEQRKAAVAGLEALEIEIEAAYPGVVGHVGGFADRPGITIHFNDDRTTIGRKPYGSDYYVPFDRAIDLVKEHVEEAKRKKLAREAVETDDVARIIVPPAPGLVEKVSPVPVAAPAEAPVVAEAPVRVVKGFHIRDTGAGEVEPYIPHSHIMGMDKSMPVEPGKDYSILLATCMAMVVFKEKGLPVAVSHLDTAFSFTERSLMGIKSFLEEPGNRFIIIRGPHTSGTTTDLSDLQWKYIHGLMEYLRDDLGIPEPHIYAHMTENEVGKAVYEKRLNPIGDVTKVSIQANGVVRIYYMDSKPKPTDPPWGSEPTDQRVGSEFITFPGMEAPRPPEVAAAPEGAKQPSNLEIIDSINNIIKTIADKYGPEWYKVGQPGSVEAYVEVTRRIIEDVAAGKDLAITRAAYTEYLRTITTPDTQKMVVGEVMIPIRSILLDEGVPAHVIENHASIVSFMETMGIRDSVCVNFDYHEDAVALDNAQAEGRWARYAMDKKYIGKYIWVNPEKHDAAERAKWLEDINSSKGPIVITVCYDYFPFEEGEDAVTAKIDEMREFLLGIKRPVKLFVLARSSGYAKTPSLVSAVRKGETFDEDAFARRLDDLSGRLSDVFDEVSRRASQPTAPAAPQVTPEVAPPVVAPAVPAPEPAELEKADLEKIRAFDGKLGELINAEANGNMERVGELAQELPEMLQKSREEISIPLYEFYRQFMTADWKLPGAVDIPNKASGVVMTKAAFGIDHEDFIESLAYLMVAAKEARKKLDVFLRQAPPTPTAKLGVIGPVAPTAAVVPGVGAAVTEFLAGDAWLNKAIAELMPLSSTEMYERLEKMDFDSMMTLFTGLVERDEIDTTLGQGVRIAVVSSYARKILGYTRAGNFLKNGAFSQHATIMLVPATDKQLLLQQNPRNRIQRELQRALQKYANVHIIYYNADDMSDFDMPEEGEGELEAKIRGLMHKPDEEVDSLREAGADRESFIDPMARVIIFTDNEGKDEDNTARDKVEKFLKVFSKDNITGETGVVNGSFLPDPDIQESNILGFLAPFGMGLCERDRAVDADRREEIGEVLKGMLLNMVTNPEKFRGLSPREIIKGLFNNKYWMDMVKFNYQEIKELMDAEAVIRRSL